MLGSEGLGGGKRVGVKGLGMGGDGVRGLGSSGLELGSRGLSEETVAKTLLVVQVKEVFYRALLVNSNL